jgi:hypothetical protein
MNLDFHDERLRVAGLVAGIECPIDRIKLLNEEYWRYRKNFPSIACSVFFAGWWIDCVDAIESLPISEAEKDSIFDKYDWSN